MKALITILDDDGAVLKKDCLIPSSQHGFNGYDDIYDFHFQFAKPREEAIQRAIREGDYKWQSK